MKRQAPTKAKIFRRIGTLLIVLLDTRRAPLRQWVRHLPAADRRAWRAIRHRQGAKLFLASRAMALPMARHLDRRNRRLVRLPSGQPILQEGCISISRCYPFVAFALARRPVGLDLERIRDDDELIAAVSLAFADDEQAMIGCSAFPPGCFCRTWSRKEALAKLAGTGICTDLARLDTLRHGDGLHSMRLGGGYWLSVVASAAPWQACRQGRGAGIGARSAAEQQGPAWTAAR